MRILASALCGLAVAGAATASPIMLPDGRSSGIESWTESWNLGGVSYDFLGLAMITGGRTFAAPIFSNFSVGGWDLIGEFGQTPVLAAAAGPVVPGMQFATTFAGSSSEPLKFDVHMFNGDIYMGGIGLDWDGSEWSVVPSARNMTKAEFEAAIIPAPAGAAVAGLGLMALGRRRRTA